jgi:beta-lactamase regulating signal transducer with metallopeptidase domain
MVTEFLDAVSPTMITLGWQATIVLTIVPAISWWLLRQRAADQPHPQRRQLVNRLGLVALGLLPILQFVPSFDLPVLTPQPEQLAVLETTETFPLQSETLYNAVIVEDSSFGYLEPNASPGLVEGIATVQPPQSVIDEVWQYTPAEYAPVDSVVATVTSTEIVGSITRAPKSTIQEYSSFQWPFTWQASLIITWGFIVVLLLSIWITHYIKLRRIIGDMVFDEVKSKRLESLLVQSASLIGIKKVPCILVCSQSPIESPFIAGVLRPTIYLPQELLQRIDDSDLRSIISHELAHLKSNDLVWLHFYQLAAILCWFHPCAWWLKRNHAQTCEEIADLRASASLDQSSDYRGMLARVALLVHRPNPAFQTALLMADRSARIKQRLDLLKLNVTSLSPREQLKAWLLGTTALVLLAFIFQARLGYADPEIPEPTETEETVSDEEEIDEPEPKNILSRETTFEKKRAERQDRLAAQREHIQERLTRLAHVSELEKIEDQAERNVQPMLMILKEDTKIKKGGKTIHFLAVETKDSDHNANFVIVQPNNEKSDFSMKIGNTATLGTQQMTMLAITPHKDDAVATVEVLFSEAETTTDGLNISSTVLSTEEATNLTKLFSFIYKQELENARIEAIRKEINRRQGKASSLFTSEALKRIDSAELRKAEAQQRITELETKLDKSIESFGKAARANIMRNAGGRRRLVEDRIRILAKEKASAKIKSKNNNISNSGDSEALQKDDSPMPLGVITLQLGNKIKHSGYTVSFDQVESQSTGNSFKNRAKFNFTSKGGQSGAIVSPGTSLTYGPFHLWLLDVKPSTQDSPAEVRVAVVEAPKPSEGLRTTGGRLNPAEVQLVKQLSTLEDKIATNENKIDEHVTRITALLDQAVDSGNGEDKDVKNIKPEIKLLQSQIDALKQELKHIAIHLENAKSDLYDRAERDFRLRVAYNKQLNDTALNSNQVDLKYRKADELIKFINKNTADSDNNKVSPQSLTISNHILRTKTVKSHHYNLHDPANHVNYIDLPMEKIPDLIAGEKVAFAQGHLEFEIAKYSSPSNNFIPIGKFHYVLNNGLKQSTFWLKYFDLVTIGSENLWVESLKVRKDGKPDTVVLHRFTTPEKNVASSTTKTREVLDSKQSDISEATVDGVSRDKTMLKAKRAQELSKLAGRRTLQYGDSQYVIKLATGDISIRADVTREQMSEGMLDNILDHRGEVLFSGVGKMPLPVQRRDYTLKVSKDQKLKLLDAERWSPSNPNTYEALYEYKHEREANPVLFKVRKGDLLTVGKSNYLVERVGVSKDKKPFIQFSYFATPASGEHKGITNSSANHAEALDVLQKSDIGKLMEAEKHLADKIVTASFKKVPLHRVFSVLEKEADLTIHAANVDLGPAVVSIRLKDIPILEALNKVLKGTPFAAIAINDKNIQIVRLVRDKRIDLKLKETPLKDVLKLIQHHTGAAISYIEDDIKDGEASTELVDVPMGSALEGILKVNGLMATEIVTNHFVVHKIGVEPESLTSPKLTSMPGNPFRSGPMEFNDPFAAGPAQTNRATTGLSGEPSSSPTRISLKINEGSLINALKAIEEQANITIIYDEDTVRGKKVTTTEFNGGVGAVFASILRSHQLTATRIVSSVYIVHPLNFYAPAATTPDSENNVQSNTTISTEFNTLLLDYLQSAKRTLRTNDEIEYQNITLRVVAVDANDIDNTNDDRVILFARMPSKSQSVELTESNHALVGEYLISALKVNPLKEKGKGSVELNVSRILFPQKHPVPINALHPSGITKTLSLNDEMVYHNIKVQITNISANEKNPNADIARMVVELPDDKRDVSIHELESEWVRGYRITPQRIEHADNPNDAKVYLNIRPSIPQQHNPPSLNSGGTIRTLSQNEELSYRGIDIQVNSIDDNEDDETKGATAQLSIRTARSSRNVKVVEKDILDIDSYRIKISEILRSEKPGDGSVRLRLIPLVSRPVQTAAVGPGVDPFAGGDRVDPFDNVVAGFGGGFGGGFGAPPGGGFGSDPFASASQGAPSAFGQPPAPEVGGFGGGFGMPGGGFAPPFSNPEERMNQRVTLKFEKTPLKEALTEISQRFMVNLVYNDDIIRGREVTADLRDVPLSQAIDSILEVNDLAIVERSNNVWTIHFENRVPKVTPKQKLVELQVKNIKFEETSALSIVRMFQDLVDMDEFDSPDWSPSQLMNTKITAELEGPIDGESALRYILGTQNLRIRWENNHRRLEIFQASGQIETVE